MTGTWLAQCVALAVMAAEPPVYSDRPNEVAFPAQRAKFVRFVIQNTSGGQPCIDELEVYGPEEERNLAAASAGAKATASSCLPGHAIHQVAHLNDGRYGNDHSWIAARAEDEWAQIELPRAAEVCRVVFSRDRNRHYADRVPVCFEVQLSSDGRAWKSVKRVETVAAPVAVRRRPGEFAGVVPPPPPPPAASGGQFVFGSEPFQPEVARRDPLGLLNLALSPEAEAAASSLLDGYAIHQVAHLNDGRAGNEHSWISREDPSWAEIDLGGVCWIYRVAFGSDSSGKYHDRAATRFWVLTATEHDDNSEAATWNVVHRQHEGPPVHARREFKFRPVRARWVRIVVEASSKNQVRIDEIEVYGRSEPIALAEIGPLPPAEPTRSVPDYERQLREAFLAEEHAWLKTYGRADLSPRLVPYNGRVKEYPRHVGDDRLPLPPLSTGPRLDGRPDDPCWAEASRGVVRVACPVDFDEGPLVSCSVSAGRHDGHLVLAVQASRLLSRYLAVVSTADGRGCGVVACTSEGLVFNTYSSERGAV
ncbi:MAG: hypothetical protein ACYTG0_41650, partial [Planctomycetota bacterium]